MVDSPLSYNELDVEAASVLEVLHMQSYTHPLPSAF